jgi:hypothetical protein
MRANTKDGTPAKAFGSSRPKPELKELHPNPLEVPRQRARDEAVGAFLELARVSVPLPSPRELGTACARVRFASLGRRFDGRRDAVRIGPAPEAEVAKILGNACKVALQYREDMESLGALLEEHAGLTREQRQDATFIMRMAPLRATVQALEEGMEQAITSLNEVAIHEAVRKKATARRHADVVEPGDAPRKTPGVSSGSSPGGGLFQSYNLKSALALGGGLGGSAPPQLPVYDWLVKVVAKKAAKGELPEPHEWWTPKDEEEAAFVQEVRATAERLLRGDDRETVEKELFRLANRVERGARHAIWEARGYDGPKW